MNLEIVLPGERAEIVHICDRQYRPTHTIMRVFNDDQLGPRQVYVAERTNCRLYFIQLQRAIGLIFDDMGGNTAQPGRPADLIQKCVGSVTHNDFIRPSGMGEQGDQVAHRPTDGQQGRLRCPAFQR